MNDSPPGLPPGSHLASPNESAPLASPVVLALLLVLFVGGGCAAMIYEIVWFQSLEMAVGASAVSLGILLATFMGGMCLGSLLAPRWISPSRNPLQVYGVLELGIGLFGLATLFLIPFLAHVYPFHYAPGLPSILWRGLVCGTCLLPPAMLMGATLPTIARYVEMTPRGVSWLGWLYGGGLVGAVIGCGLAGFYLLRTGDTATATYSAVAINAFVGASALVLAAVVRQRVTPGEPAAATEPSTASDDSGVYLAIGLSGLSALAAEVVWTRLLSMTLGSTVYAFSIILAVFLAGLGIGSGIGSLIARRTLQPRIAFGICQLLLVAFIAWGALLIAKAIPYWPINASLAKHPVFTFELDLARCAWAVLPAACLWGASFPLALASLARRGADPGRVTGQVYAANTVGALVGALVFSLIILPAAGTQRTQQIMMVISMASGLLLLAPLLSPYQRDRDPTATTPRSKPQRDWVTGNLSLALAVIAALILTYYVPPLDWGLVAYGRGLPYQLASYDLVTTDQQIQDLEDKGYTAWVKLLGTPLEGMNASAVATIDPDQFRYLHVNGRIEATTGVDDGPRERLLGHLPALFHAQPKSVLVAGCGTGITAGTFLLHPSIEKIVICEIEPVVVEVAARHFQDVNYGVLEGYADSKPRPFDGMERRFELPLQPDMTPPKLRGKRVDKEVRIVYDDARHFLSTTDEKFDIIVCDSGYPWVRGAAALATTEFFEICKSRLNSGGLITQWLPFYNCDEAVVKSQVRTFLDVFKNGTLWCNDVAVRDPFLLGVQVGVQGYDGLLLAERDGIPIVIQLDELERKLEEDKAYSEVALSLVEVEYHRDVPWSEANNTGMPYLEYDDPTKKSDQLRKVRVFSLVKLLSTYAGKDSDLLQMWGFDGALNTDGNLRLQYLAGLRTSRIEAKQIREKMSESFEYPENMFVGSDEITDELRKAIFDGRKQLGLDKGKKAATEGP